MTMSSGSIDVGNSLKVWDTGGSSIHFSGGTITTNSFSTDFNPANFVWTGGHLKHHVAGPQHPARLAIGRQRHRRHRQAVDRACWSARAVTGN